MKIPLLPLTIIGTAVAFYVGFKNNQAYDRLWEARKIWGAIVNSSRAWGSAIKAYVSNKFRAEKLSEDALITIRRRLIYRHIAWLYSLRSQLLIPTPWEHISQGRHVGKLAQKRRKEFGIGLLDDEITKDELHIFLADAEYEKLINFKNTATQIIDHQSQDLVQLREADIIEDFRHIELQNILNDFYVHQGKCERIKKFPLPRQFGGMSFLFIGIFIFLLPFGMISAFDEMGQIGVWLAIPFGVLVAWVYLSMELVGDYSENPFEGSGNDIPMYSLCRVIEIDLREMLGETDLPPEVEAKNGVLL
jgi:putative membrane protein